MSRDIWIGLFIGAMVGSALGGFVYKTRHNLDADLIVYQSMAPTPVPTTPEPTPTPQMPDGWCLCPTPHPTEVPLTAKELEARKAWFAVEVAEIKAHAEDFVPMPYPKTMYQGVPVEFLADGPRKWINEHDYEPIDEPKEHKKQKTAYEKFYGIHPQKDKTMVNGFKRSVIFDWLNDKEFEYVHKPFYGIRSFWKTCGSPECGSRPSPRWIYVVWSVKYKAPIPFAYPSEAIKLVQRQGKR